MLHGQSFSGLFLHTHWVRATWTRAWLAWLPYSGHHVASNLCYHCEGRFAIAPRLAYLSRRTPTRVCTRCEFLRASEALRLDSSISASRPSRSIQLVGGYNDWKCMRGAFVVLSFLSWGSLLSPSILTPTLSLSPSRSARIDFSLARGRKTSGTVDRNYRGNSSRTRGGRLFPPKDGCTVARPHRRGFSPGK